VWGEFVSCGITMQELQTLIIAGRMLAFNRITTVNGNNLLKKYLLQAYIYSVFFISYSLKNN
jgi:hypothetical protein